MESVVLIIPPNPFLEDERRNCPLGILYVAAALEQAGYDAKVVDLRGVPKELWDIAPSQVYGITSSSIDFPYAVEVAHYLRERGPCKIIIGGAHTVALDECLQNGFSVVVGEGERAILDMLQNDLQVAQSPLIDDLDSIPFPARHLLPRESVVSTALCHQGVPATTITASRGCPFNCLYCASPRIWSRRVRRHSPEYTVREVETLVRDYGVKELRFQDDEANLDRKWLEAIAPRMSELGIKWRGHARAEAGNWELLREAGCYEVGIGVETANPESHKLHKKADLEKTKECIWAAHKAGLVIRLCFIVGLPYDYGDISGRTIAFLEEMPDLHGIFLNILSPFPGSEIGDHPERFGLRHVKLPTTNVLQGDTPEFTFDLDGITREELTYHYLRIRDYLQGRKWILP